MTTSGAGDWVERWLSRPRFGVYLAAVGGDRPTALQLYEWNATVSAAFMRDLAHLEVALRNAYDDALTSGLPPRGMHWVFDPTRYFPTVWKTARNGARYNDNHEPQRLIAQATATALLSVQAAARTTQAGRAGHPSAGEGRRRVAVRVLALPVRRQTREAAVGALPAQGVRRRHQST